MRRWLIWIARLVLIALVIGVVGGYWFANRYYNDEALARRISEGFNETHRGRLEIGSIHWDTSAVWALVKNGYDDVEVRDLRIYDSRGELALHVPRAVGRIRLWDIILRGDFFLRRLTFNRATVYLERYRRPDGPTADGDATEIGLLGAFEKRPPRTPEKRRERREERPSRQSFIVVDRFDLSGITVRGDLGEVGLRLREVGLRGRLHYESSGAGKSASLRYDLQPRARRGEARYGPQRFELTEMNVRRLAATRERPDRVVVDARVGVDAALVSVRGGLFGLGQPEGPSVSLEARMQHFGPLLSKLSGREVRDEGSRFVAEVSGPVADPAADLRLGGLGLQHGHIRLSKAQVTARYETGVLRVSEATAELLDGDLRARAELRVGSGRWRATVTARRLDLGPALPRSQQQMAGRLSGWLDASGALGDPRRGWTRFDLTVDRGEQPGPLPPKVRASGVLHASARRMDIRRLAVQSDLLNLESHGQLWPETQRMDLALKVQARRLRRFLLRLGKPPLVAAVSLAGRARGRLTNPRFAGQGALYGVRSGPVSLRAVTAAVGLRDGTLAAGDIRGRIYGGGLYGRARVGLYAKDVRRMRPQPLIWARGGVRALDLEPATGGAVEALVNGRFQVRGTPAYLQGRVRAKSKILWAARQWYRDAALDVRFRGPRYTLSQAAIRREAGGHLKASGSFSTRRDGRIDLAVDVSRLPLAAVPGLDGDRPPVSGTVNTRSLRVQGTFGAPVLAGTVALVRAKIRGVPAGDGELRLLPRADHTALEGRLLSWLSVVRGRLDLGARKGVSLRLRFEDVPLERFAPELRRAEGEGSLEGRLSGTLDLEVGAPGGVRTARLSIDKLVVRMEKPPDYFEGLPGETAELRNDGPIRLRFEGDRLVVDRCVLTDQDRLHRLTVAGFVGGTDSDLRVRGRVDLLPAEILLSESLQRLRGVVGVDLRLRGPLARPRLRGSLFPAGILVRTEALAGDVVVRAGRVDVTNEALSLRVVRLQVVDDEAELNGRIRLEDFQPRDLDLRLRGELSARALEVFAGHTVERVRGQPSRVELTARGTLDAPVIHGRVQLGRMSMGLRSLGKELAIKSGRMDFRGSRLRVTDVRGTLDDGPFELNGDVYLAGVALDGVNLHLVGEGIPHRSGGSYEVQISPDVRLRGSGPPATGYTLAGVVNVVEGRYFQKFNINPVQRILTPSRVRESSGPFWEGSDLLANLRLDLTVTTTGSMRVKNNIADIGLEGDLSVTGTLPAMRIGGTVDVQEGTFRIPFLRGRYSGATGTVDFDRGQSRVGPSGKTDEPYVHLVGTTVYTDRSDTEHEITLTVTGYLSRLVPRWSSNTGLNSSQVLTLLATSRTPDDLRKGRSAALPNLAPLIEDYIPMDLQFDLSTESVQVYVERKLGRYFRLKGESEFGYTGSQRQEGMIIFKILDNVSLQGKIRRRVQGEDVTEEDDTLSGRVEAKYKIRLRGGLRRSLGF